MSRTSEITRNQILLYLADGEFYSGEMLGRKLGISRTTVSKHIRALSELGLDIFTVTGKGYKLARLLQLMDQQQIKTFRKIHNAPVQLLNVVDSTNTYLKNTSGLHKNGGCCLAEAQTAGRGRQGRRWISPFGASLYLSMYWGFQGGYQVLGGLSLVIGVAVVRALKAFGGISAQLKWPNDVYLNGKKLAGILVEIEGQLDDVSHCYIGVGLNIQMPTDPASAIDQPWTDLYTEMGSQVNRNQLASTLLDHLYQLLHLFAEQGLTPFLKEWQAYNLFQDKWVKMLCGPKDFSGQCRGINDQGALLVETGKGMQAFYGGEISVRAHS
ncbi:bifunctional biotin--[acetyl-CoA-carboxylase] ligase/biotin operon repressor BirA [Lacimicrobium alkaliphilum]|uniref:Bifunctional ligase/repressor BirA n=1 Tax=Lacimicrobium alkaliphilum TaxID=1526571 RepID=A0ABQ1RRJ2_9ALTE|nr:bifunctional biotin--[acetyl-CoA-carboxylase] ligase/biotin operon repressor BirA [Lacimicrobium alkaliphilum]GGD79369.1 bifunctional ligase/repressor BirA [Lacimicrobium alkaliphilum]